MGVGKTWVATADSRTRPDHRALGGRTVRGLEAPFTAADGTKLRWPHDPEAPAHQTIQCRCVLTWKLVPKARPIDPAF